MISPATTSVSLFARAMSFPFFIALIVGLNPTNPTKALTRIFASSIVATAFNPSSPSIKVTFLYFGSI